MNKNGFTLIELLVVLAIMAILTLIAITVYADIQEKTRDAKRKNDIDALAKALEVHKIDSGYQSLQNDYFDPGVGLPKADSQGIVYCLKADTADPPTSSAGWNTTDCPSSWSGSSKVAVGVPAGYPTSWGVCSLLERDFTRGDGNTTKIYCRFNNQ